MDRVRRWALLLLFGATYVGSVLLFVMALVQQAR
jgi:hypothetical protein